MLLEIINENQVIITEDLQIKNMVKNYLRNKARFITENDVAELAKGDTNE